MSGNPDVTIARMWPREIFDKKEAGGKKLLARGIDFLQKPGVYILYRDEHPYYIGKADNLYRRLKSHAVRPQAKYYNFWNFFSAFAVSGGWRDRLEGILIAAMPTVNSAEPRLTRETLPANVAKLIKEMRGAKVNDYGPAPAK
jgi:hypothetical protein